MPLATSPTTKAAGLQTSAADQASHRRTLSLLLGEPWRGRGKEALQLEPVLFSQWPLDRWQTPTILMQLCEGRHLNQHSACEHPAHWSAAATAFVDIGAQALTSHPTSLIPPPLCFSIGLHVPTPLPLILWSPSPFWSPYKGRLSGDLSHQNQLPTKQVQVWFLKDL